METTRSEKRLQALALLAALFCIAVSILDVLNLVPGIGGRLLPLLIGILLLYLLPLGHTISRTRRQGATIQRKVDALRNNLRQASPPDRRTSKVPAPASRPPVYREIRWHGLTLHSHSEVKIAKALDRTGALFIPACKIRLKTEAHRQTREVDFLVCYQGQWAILEVDGPHHQHSTDADTWRDDRFLEHGIRVSRYPASQCYQNPQEVVRAFLDGLDRSQPTDFAI